MPVNYQQIRSAIRAAGQQMPQHALKMQARRVEVMSLFAEHASDPDLLRERAEWALGLNADLRFAIPGTMPLDFRIMEDPSLPTPILWAADGSQIIPDGHLALQFGVINVGLIRLCAGETPFQAIESQLLFADDLYNAQGHLLGEESIALRRDSQERTTLLQATLGEKSAVLTLTDGPLELFRDLRNSNEYQQQLQNYLSILSQMAELHLLTAGYVDKPRSDLVVRLLELLTTSEQDITKNQRRLAGIADAEIFAKLLQPGERSAVFGLQSPSTRQFKGDLALHFFYLNVGRSGKAQIARVELPAWVAKHEVNINIIQHALLAQCRQMGSKSYPYILHRAHETAMVSFDERNQLLNLLQIEMLNQGQAAGETSNKQQAKNLPGKTRFGQ